MKKIVVLFLIGTSTISCQDFGKLQLVCDLPKTFNEISGIERTKSSDLLWAINDSNNAAKLYGFDPETCEIKQTKKLPKGSNKDWEDLTTNGQGTLYIGDFGNNQNTRKDLTIYHVNIRDSLNSETVTPIKTTFRYEDQKDFPPKKNNVSFDVEAFIYLDNHFYLFTRNRTRRKKFNGIVNIYKVPAREGDFKAQLVDSFVSCGDSRDCQITAASIDHETGKVALLSYNKVWIFSEYEGDDFDSGTITKIKLEHSSQKESICFKSENELYIADEKNRGGRNLYLLKLDAN